MELTAFASWLNTFFAEFDRAILGFYHSLAVAAGNIFTPIAIVFDLIGELGIFCFLVAIVFLLFAKTRKTGVTIIFAVLFGALFTNLIIKEAVARPRPFSIDAEFAAWWQYIGAPHQGKFSFPSGHVTSAMAGMTAIALTRSPKWIAPAALYVIIMGATRNYLMVHYPSDVIGGMIVGGVAAVLAVFTVRWLFELMNKNPEQRFCRFMLCADIRNTKSK